jgi:hypothetical protein
MRLGSKSKSNKLLHDQGQTWNWQLDFQMLELVSAFPRVPWSPLDWRSESHHLPFPKLWTNCHERFQPTNLRRRSESKRNLAIAAIGLENNNYF